LGSVRVGLHVREQGTTTASGICECYYLVSSCLLNSGVPGFGCPGLVFLLIEFPLRQQKSFCCLLSALIFLLHTLHTLVFYLEVNFIFHVFWKEIMKLDRTLRVVPMGC
jgi:hypothetical protein